MKERLTYQKSYQFQNNYTVIISFIRVELTASWSIVKRSIHTKSSLINYDNNFFVTAYSVLPHNNQN